MIQLNLIFTLGGLHTNSDALGPCPEWASSPYLQYTVWLRPRALRSAPCAEESKAKEQKKRKHLYPSLNIFIVICHLCVTSCSGSSPGMRDMGTVRPVIYLAHVSVFDTRTLPIQAQPGFCF